MIHVCLLSCDRFDYTVKTAQSFLEHNPSGFRLWHADDASTDPRLRPTVQAMGFHQLEYTDARAGVTEMVRRIASRLQRIGAEWMLLLENDWETVRPFPGEVFREIQARGDVWALRLYGRYKARNNRHPVREYHQGRGRASPNWRAFDGYEVGDIHWGNPPSVARVASVVWVHEGVRTEKQAIERSGFIQDHVARVAENVVYHIGTQRTEGFLA